MQCDVSARHLVFFFFFNDTATTEIYTLSLHDALPIWIAARVAHDHRRRRGDGAPGRCRLVVAGVDGERRRWPGAQADRKSTRLNSSHGYISYAVFCLKKKKQHTIPVPDAQLRLYLYLS